MKKKSVWSVNFGLNIKYHLLVCLFLFVSLILSSSVLAFTADKVGDFTDITVIEVSGNYDAKLPDGSGNNEPRMAITNLFYKTHSDTYDFIIVFTDFDFLMFDDALAFYNPIKNDTQGIGKDLFDYSSYYGSNGKLQGMIDMGNQSGWAVDPVDPEFSFLMGVLSHELLHRWGAFVKFIDHENNISSDLIGSYDAHWSFLLDTNRSLQLGNTWRDNNDGTFTTLESRKYFSPLDLYLMGFIDKSKVPPMLLIESDEVEKTRVSEKGVTINGTPRYVTIDNIISAEGDRVPDYTNSQKEFKIGCIYLTSPGSFNEENLVVIRKILRNWEVWYSSLTDGISTVHFDASPSSDIPFNPGTEDPEFNPRQNPPEIEDGVSWLISNQIDNNHWMDIEKTMERDTSMAILALSHFENAESVVMPGIQWMLENDESNIDYLSKKIQGLKEAGEVTGPYVDKLLGKRNSDGFWGNTNKHISNPEDTSNALLALSATGFTDYSIIDDIVGYLINTQNADGGWGGSSQVSSIRTTATVLQAVEKYNNVISTFIDSDKAINWLLAQQNYDGGFGDNESTVYSTSIAVLALRNYTIPGDVFTDAKNYILNFQAENGSWFDSVYQTALAIQTLYAMNEAPDISLFAGDITMSPLVTTQVPVSATMSVLVKNKGFTAASDVKIVLYDDIATPDNKIGDIVVSVDVLSEETITFSFEVTDGGYHRYIVIADPDVVIPETNRQNNTAIKLLKSEQTYDFRIEQGDLTISPESIDVKQDVTFTSVMHNSGTGDAFNVPLKYYIDNGASVYEIATVLIDIPSGGSTSHVYTWNASFIGSGLNLFAQVDPLNTITELSEVNNTTSGLISIIPNNQPNLFVTESDLTITPDPLNEGKTCSVQVRIRNNGGSSSPGNSVSLFVIESGKPDQLIERQTINAILPGEESLVNFEWAPIPIYGDAVISVVVDSENSVSESNEQDNNTFKKVTIKSLPDFIVQSGSISFSPSAPSEGDLVDIHVTVLNTGEQAGEQVQVDIFDNDVLLESSTIPSISGNSQADISLSYDTAGKTGTHKIRVEVNPGNVHIERTNTNNTALSILGIQNSDLWLSNRYITVKNDNSGNNDEIANTTDFYFRLSEPQTYFVRVKDQYDRVLRNFDSPDFKNSTGNTVTWDGLDNFGYTVVDGEYRMQVVSESGTVLKELPVTVDNNLSSLPVSYISEYTALNNLTCTLPDIDENHWFSDESGMVLRIYEENEYTPEYTPGIYTITPDGSGITRLVPLEWNDPDSEFNYRYVNYESGSLKEDCIFISPDNQFIAFIAQKHSGSGYIESQLWVVDRFGNNLQLIDRMNIGNGVFKTIKWTHNSEYLVYQVGQEWSDYINEIRFSKTDGSDPVMDDINAEIYQSDMSLNGQHLILETQSGFFTADPIELIREIDPVGTNHRISHVKWLNGDLYLVAEQDLNNPDNMSVYFRNINDSSYYERITSLDNTNKIHSVVPSPRGDMFTIVYRKNDPAGTAPDYTGNFNGWKNEYGYWNIDVINLDGEVRHLHSAYYISELPDDKVSISDLKWSKQGDRFLFVDHAYEATDLVYCKFYGQLFVWDSLTDEIKSYPVTNEQDLCEEAELPESYHILLQNSNSWVEEGVLHFGSKFETQSLGLDQSLVGGDFTIRVFQTGTDKAAVDYIALRIDGKIYPVESAYVLSDKRDIHQDILSLDENIADVVAETMVLSWSSLPEHSDYVEFILNANEENNPVNDPGNDPGNNSNTNSRLALVQNLVPDSIDWFYDGVWIKGTDDNGIFALNTYNAEVVELDFSDTISTDMNLSPFSRYLIFENYVDSGSVCQEKGDMDLWSVRSLLNLGIDLFVLRDDYGFEIKGTAADLNFKEFILEYSTGENPDEWNLIRPHGRKMYYDETLAYWAPPQLGTFNVKLTVIDQAGNQTYKIKRVYWGKQLSVGDFSSETDYFSPNGDGILDFIRFNYSVLEDGLHLNFYILNQEGDLVHEIDRSYLNIPEPDGKDNIIWDGRNTEGEIQPDGVYSIQFNDYSYEFILDITPPLVNVELSEINLIKSSADDDDTTYVIADIRGIATDLNYMSNLLEYGEGHNPDNWYELEPGPRDPIEVPDDSEEDPYPIIKQFNNEFDLATGKTFRYTAVDLAGNRTTKTTEIQEEVFILRQWKWESDANADWIELGLQYSGPEDTIVGEVIPVSSVKPGKHSFSAEITSWKIPQSYCIQYEGPSGLWIDGPLIDGGVRGSVSLSAKFTGDEISYTDISAIRIKALMPDGTERFSNIIETDKETSFGLKCDETRLNSYIGEIKIPDRLKKLTLSVEKYHGYRYIERQWDTAQNDKIPSLTFWIDDVNAGNPPLRIGDKLILEGESEDDPNKPYYFEKDVEDCLIYDVEPTCFARGLESSFKPELFDPTLVESITFIQEIEGEEPVVLDSWDIANGDTIPSVFPEYYLLDSIFVTKINGSEYHRVDLDCFNREIICEDNALTFRVNIKEDLKYLSVLLENNKTEILWFMNRTEYQQIPSGPVDLLDLSGLKKPELEIGDIIKVIGIEQTENESISEWITEFHIEGPLCGTLEISPVSVECNNSSPGLNLSLENLDSDLEVNTIGYYIETLTRNKLLKEIDASVTDNYQHFINVFEMGENNEEVYPEGDYQVYSQIKNESGLNYKTYIDLTIDKTRPIGEISYPLDGETVCPDIIVGQDGDEILMVNIKGLVSDNQAVANYNLSYAYSEFPNIWDEISDSSDNQIVFKNWDVSELQGKEMLLKLEVTDVSQNRTCHIISVKIAGYGISVFPTGNIFSPNGDGVLDTLNVPYHTNDSGTLEITALFIDGTEEIPVLSGYTLVEGEHTFEWDGKNSSGALVPDGEYRLLFKFTNTCGMKDVKGFNCIIDTTPPDVSISYPLFDSVIPVILEISGLVNDLNFNKYSLDILAGENDLSGLNVGAGLNPVINDILGNWNNYGLENETRVIRLSAVDLAGNENSDTVMIEINRGLNLIMDLVADPQVFSPNGDEKLDVLNINYTLNTEVNEPFDVLLEIKSESGSTVRTYSREGVLTADGSAVWDGLNVSNDLAPDGKYSILLTAKLSNRPAINQIEKITVYLDTLPPEITLDIPVADSFINAALEVKTSVNDLHLEGYQIEVVGESGLTPIASGQINITEQVYNNIELADGSYSLKIQAQDTGLNTALMEHSLIVDQTPPELSFENPIPDALYGNTKHIISVDAVIIEKNIRNWTVRYRSDQSLDQWITLGTGQELPVDSHLFDWSVGKDDSIMDGRYIISLIVEDLAGWTSEINVPVEIDNTAPLVELTDPSGGYIKEIQTITGTASDKNLSDYHVEFAEGDCETAFKWTPITSGTENVTNTVLGLWQILPPDGPYCLRISASDLVGNKSETFVNVNVDTTPPQPPVLAGTIVNKVDADLSWIDQGEADIAGFNIYRNDIKVNSNLISLRQMVDPGLKEGAYVFTVTAVDHAGWESDYSNELKLLVDITPPSTQILFPGDSDTVSGLVEIMGTAFSIDDFKQYYLYAGLGESPSFWKLLASDVLPVSYGELGKWDTLSLENGSVYTLKLETEDLTGNVGEHQIQVTIDNLSPSAPVLVSVVQNDPYINEADLVWLENPEPDIEGYLIFRNGNLANVTENVTGDLQPYLIDGTIYTNTELPDGQHEYFIIAMDRTGNLSQPSNTLSVNIDIHPPHIDIIEPENGFQFDKAFLIKGETPDTDIREVRFQYKQQDQIEWIELGVPVTELPYHMDFDPEELALPYDTYLVRALATDFGGKVDEDPEIVTVIYTDVTPPVKPLNLSTLTTGGKVTLSWNGNTEPDLAGYNIYEVSKDNPVKLNAALIEELTFLHTGSENSDLSDDIYRYQVTAVDYHGNESAPSDITPAHVYTPEVLQPYTPLDTPLVDLVGYVQPLKHVTLSRYNGTDYETVATMDSDDIGNFNIPLDLLEGENHLVVQAFDDDGNISKTSEEIVVVHALPPSVPTGLAGLANGYNSDLTWNANPETDINGYHIFRDDLKLSYESLVPGGTISASHDDYTSDRARDNNIYSFWYAYKYFDDERPLWWQVEFNEPMIFSKVELEWHYEGYAVDYKIQGWSGYAWITLISVKYNENPGYDNIINTFDINPAFMTDKLRVLVTQGKDHYGNHKAYLGEFRLWRENPVEETSYQDSYLNDGTYAYQITAVNQYGMKSEPSEKITVDIGDVIPPASPINLAAAAVETSIDLNWNAPSDIDLDGYHIYRKKDSEWSRITESLVPSNMYSDADLSNGTYTYRITAVDLIGNESTPSNEDSAIIDILLPAIPIELTLENKPEGETIRACWESVDGATGYYLYRSTSPDGPFVQVDAGLIMDTCYNDMGLINGQRYYYNVVAVDTLGNETNQSLNRDMVPEDLIAPDVPMIFAPTMIGKPITVKKPLTSLAGWAEPASRVVIFQNDLYLDDATANENHGFSLFDLTYDENVDIKALDYSPDGEKMAVMIDDDGTRSFNVYNIRTGEEIHVGSIQGYKVKWSPDSSKLVYEDVNSNGQNQLLVYDLLTGFITRLPDSESFTNEGYPIWSADGKQILFYTRTENYYENIMMYDVEQQQYTQITDTNLYSKYPSISTDGNWVSFIEYDSGYKLKIVPVEDHDDIRVVEENPVGHIMKWSPQESTLAFMANHNGDYDIFLLNTDDMNITQLTQRGDIEDFTWSPEGNKLAYSISDNTSEIVLLNLEYGSEEIIETGIAGPYNLLQFTEKGELALLAENHLSVISFAGAFELEDVKLEIGENLFTAIAVDESDNFSEESNPIEIYLDSEEFPDLVITRSDLNMYPFIPVSGDMTDINLFIKNEGFASAEYVDVTISILNNLGGLVTSYSEELPILENDQNRLISFEFDTSDLNGNFSLLAEVDRYDSIFEINESNNTAFLPFYISEQGGISMETSLNDENLINHELGISVALHNAGMGQDVQLTLNILDSTDNVVDVVDSKTFTLPHTPEFITDFIWDSKGVFPGDYFVQTKLLGENDIEIENLSPFTIEPTINIKSSVVTDKQHYNFSEDVKLTPSLTNDGDTYIIPELITFLTIKDETESILFESQQDVYNLTGNVPVQLNYGWNTGTHSQGPYLAEFAVFLDDEQVSVSSTTFYIDAVSTISGSLDLDKTSVKVGEPFSASYSVLNSGNMGISDLPVTISVVDTESGDIKDTITRTINLGMNESFADDHSFESGAYSQGVHEVRLQVERDGEIITLEQAFLNVVPVTNPEDDPLLKLTGTLSCESPNILIGNPVDLIFTVTNAGNYNLDQVKLWISIPEYPNLDLEKDINLPTGLPLSGSFNIPANSMVPQGYTAKLMAEVLGRPDSVVLADCSFNFIEFTVNAPVADAGGPYIATVGEQVPVNGSLSHDEDEGTSESGESPFDSIMAYEWDSGIYSVYDYDDAVGVTVTLPAYDSTGIYEIALRVTDNTENAYPGSGLPNQTHVAFGSVKVLPVGVTDLYARPKSTKCQLTWTHLGYNPYEVYRSETGPNSGFELMTTVETDYYRAGFLDYPIQVNKDYWYRVQVVIDGEATVSEPLHVYSKPRTRTR